MPSMSVSNNSTQETIQTRPTTPEPSDADPQGLQREAAYFLRLTPNGHYVVPDESRPIPMMSRPTRVSVLQVPTEPPSPARPRSDAFAPRGGLRSYLAANDLVAALNAVQVTEDSPATDYTSTANVDRNSAPPTESAKCESTEGQNITPSAISTKSSAGAPLVTPTTTLPAAASSGSDAHFDPTPAAPRTKTLKRKRSARGTGALGPSGNPQTKDAGGQMAENPEHRPKKRGRKTAELGSAATAAKVAPAVKVLPAPSTTPVSKTRIRPTASARARKVADAPVPFSKGKTAFKKVEGKGSKGKAKAVVGVQP